jgi:hypothetical protein
MTETTTLSPTAISEKLDSTCVFGFSGRLQSDFVGADCRYVAAH